MIFFVFLAVFVFLSTLPVRGATFQLLSGFSRFSISIHAPREGSDLDVVRAGGPDDEFLSTLPVRGATRRHITSTSKQKISIHAPREGSDCLSFKSGSKNKHFYPRSP